MKITDEKRKTWKLLLRHQVGKICAWWQFPILFCDPSPFGNHETIIFLMSEEQKKKLNSSLLETHGKNVKM